LGGGKGKRGTEEERGYDLLETEENKASEGKSQNAAGFRRKK